MTHTFDALTDEQLSIIGTQVKPDHAGFPWFRVGSMISTLILASAIWFLKIAPDEKSPNTLMVEPATELLSSFVQPAADVSSISKDLGYQVDVPDLKSLGVDVTTVGESDFGGHRAAVMQYEHGYSVFLLYSFSETSKVLDAMRLVDSGAHQFYVASGGAVSVAVWKSKPGYHALASKTTEPEILALAQKVAKSLDRKVALNDGN